MSRSVAPVNVSPIIKTARWTLLILGIFYGANRLHSLRVYEKTEKPRREQKYAELHAIRKAEESKQATEEIFLLAKELEVTEFPPGWNSEI